LLSMSSVSGTIQEAANRWITASKAGNDKAGTIDSKEYILGRFIHYGDENDWPLLQGIQKHHIDEYIVWLKGRTRWEGLRDGASSKPLSSSTVNTHYRRIRAFFSWAFEQEYIPLHPCARMKQPRFTHRVIQDITPEQIDQLRALTDYKNPRISRTPLRRFRALRDRAALEICIDTCTRLSEVTGIQMRDIRYGDAVDIHLLGKGDKERWAPLNTEPSLTLMEYIEARVEYAQPGVEDLWVSAHDAKGLPLRKSWLQKVVNKLGERIGMERLHHHMFRHRFALEWVRTGYPERMLMSIGGWSKKIPDTYLAQISAEDAARLHRKGPER